MPFPCARSMAGSDRCGCGLSITVRRSPCTNTAHVTIGNVAEGIEREQIAVAGHFIIIMKQRPPYL
jgi:hypothetical protein